jgi:hypothetical protein
VIFYPKTNPNQPNSRALAATALPRIHICLARVVHRPTSHVHTCRLPHIWPCLQCSRCRVSRSPRRSPLPHRLVAAGGSSWDAATPDASASTVELTAPLHGTRSTTVARWLAGSNLRPLVSHRPTANAPPWDTADGCTH